MELPQAVKYEDLQREVLMALKPDLFEGMRFEITKPLNQNFFLSHSLFMGNMEMQTGGRQIIKTPIGNYEFGANVIHDKVHRAKAWPQSTSLRFSISNLSYQQWAYHPQALI